MSEAAKALGVTNHLIRRLITRGILHVVRAVGIDVEPLVDRGDALAGRVTDGDELRRALLRDERSHGDCADDRDDAQGFGDHESGDERL